MIIDTHAHLYFENIQADYQAILNRAKEVGITHIINIGVDPEKSQQAIEQSLEPNLPVKIYASVGIHPHNLEKYLADGAHSIAGDIQLLENLYQKYAQQVVAIGECGLDFFLERESDLLPPGFDIEDIKKIQRQLLQAQIDLAKKLNLPLSVHCRNSQDPNQPSAWEEILETLSDTQAILHCYSGDEEITNRVLDTNFIVSFAGNITYKKNDYLRAAAKLLPLDRIVVETDCPFLAPQQFRGERNEPAYMVEAIKVIADVKGLDYEKVATQTAENALRVFKIPNH